MQTDYIDQSALPAIEGGLYDLASNQDIASRTPGGNTAQVDTLTIGTPTASVAAVKKLTITTAADADAYTMQIGDFVFTGTSAGTNKTTQRDALLAQLDADLDFKALYDTAASSTDALEVTSKRKGVDVIVPATVVITATSVWDWTTTTANVIGTQFKYTLDDKVTQYGAATTNITTERDALLVILQADADYAEDVTFAAVSTNAISVTAKTAGTPFSATYLNENHLGQAGVGTVTYSTTTANVSGQPIKFGRGLTRTATANVAVKPSVAGFVFEGISVARAKGRPKDNTVSPPVTGEAQYYGDEAFPVLRKGRIWVRPEDAITPATAVYLRHTVDSGDATKTPGRFRGADDATKVDLIQRGARWLTSAGAGELAVLEIDVEASIMA